MDKKTFVIYSRNAGQIPLEAVSDGYVLVIGALDHQHVEIWYDDLGFLHVDVTEQILVGAPSDDWNSKSIEKDE